MSVLFGAPPASRTQADGYDSMTKAQLTELAKERGIAVPKGVTKGAIIELLMG